MAGVVTPIGLVAPMNGKCCAVTVATFATPITLTIGSNGFQVGDYVDVNGVGGNTAANGSWRIGARSGVTITLEGSVGNGVYTSGGVVTPAGWVAADGATYAWALYPQLRALIGTTFGGVNLTNYIVPDTTDRFGFGVDAAQARITVARQGGSAATVIGAVGGADTHSLVQAETPEHTHGPGNLTPVAFDYGGAYSEGYAFNNAPDFAGRVMVSSAYEGVVSGQTEAYGAGGVHDNLPPYVEAHDCIFAGMRDPAGVSRQVMLPMGTMAFHAGLYEPGGWLHLNGQAKAQGLIPNLHAMWFEAGYPSGVSQAGGTTTLPDLRGRSFRGKPRGPFRYYGEGWRDAYLSSPPSHKHLAGGYRVAYRSVTAEGFAGVGLNAGSAGSGWMDRTMVNGSTRALKSGSAGYYTGQTGSGSPHNNMPPYLGLALVLKEGGQVIPLGFLARYLSISAPPSGWVVCDGAVVSRATYAALFALLNAIGLPFGAGDGSTTFNVPDLRGRMPLVFSTLGGTGAGGQVPVCASLGYVPVAGAGEEWAELTVACIPPHSHGGGELASEGKGTVDEATPGFHYGPVIGGTSFVNRGMYSGLEAWGWLSVSGNSGGMQGGSGGATPKHQNMPKFIALPWIMRAL